jgi:CheY-specific phosphatase CheX
MSTQPKITAEKVTEILSAVTQSMFQDRFEVATSEFDINSYKTDGSMVGQTLAMSGDGHLDLVAVCSSRCGARFAGNVFGCNEADATTELAEDAVGELLNVIAGQIKSHLGSSHALGLPKRYDPSAEQGRDKKAAWEGKLMVNATKEINLWVGMRVNS